MRRCRIESLGISAPRKRLFRRGSLWHAVQAGRRCLSESRHLPGDVGVIINAGVYRDEHICEPAIAAYIQHRLGINIEFQGRQTLSFDLLNGGCGMLNAVHVMTAVLGSGKINAGMIIGSEANSDRLPDRSWPYADSGVALLMDLSPRNTVGFGSFFFETREAHAERYTSVLSLKKAHGQLVICRQVAELEKAWLDAAAAVVEGALAMEGMGREQIDLVIPAQISKSLLGQLPVAIRFPKEKVLDLTDDLPDTLTTSVFLALDRARSIGRLVEGQKALLLTFASGITVGCAIYHF